MEPNPSIGRLRIAEATGSVGAGKYRVFANLGRGGMADVSLGVAQGPKGFNKLVVVKRLRALLADDSAVVNMFLDEARLAARLNHPNVIHTYEFGEENGTYFIAMEYLDGQSLAAVLQAEHAAGKAVAPGIWAKIVSEALAGLHHAHELRDYDGTPLGVVHRDVSPQNIVVTHDGRVKLVDFGIAKASLNLTETESQIIKGKLAYMAPEQADPHDGEPLDRRADIFAMGIVLWECLAEQRLITGDARAAMTKIVDMEFKAPSRSNPRVPPELDAITLRALERAPEKRYQTAQEMREAIEKYLRGCSEVIGEVQIGRLMDELFAGEHEDLKADIRSYMERLGSEREMAVGSGSGSGPAPRQALAIADRAPPLTESARSLRAVRTSSSWKPHEPRGAWGLRIAATVAATVLVLSIAASMRTSRPPANAAASPSASAPARPAPVRVTVRATPEDAVVDVDDAVVQNPFTGTFARDEIEHRVHASRSGFLPLTKLVRFDRDDVLLELTLEKTPPEAPASGSTRSALPPPSPVGAAPPAKKQPKLDDDPWR